MSSLIKIKETMTSLELVDLINREIPQALDNGCFTK